MIKLSSRAIAINVGAGAIIAIAAVSYVRATFARPNFEACSARYHRQLVMRLDRSGVPMTPADVQSLANGQDEGVLDNLSIAQFKEGPAKFALGVKVAAGTSRQRDTERVPGGISLPWTPSLLEQPRAACLSYAVFLPPDFDFEHGGTLPGLYATTINAQYTDLPHAGINLAWAQGGVPRLFVESRDKDGQNAVPFSTYSQQLPRGRWVRVDQEIVLNTPGQRDGQVRMWFDGELEIEVKSAELRGDAAVAIAGVSGDVFFGGSGTGGKAKTDSTIWLSPFELRWN